MTDLKELTDFWNKKYPGVTVKLWNNPYNKSFVGQIIGLKDMLNLEAGTFGELIAQGESFLRKERFKF